MAVGWRYDDPWFSDEDDPDDDATISSSASETSGKHGKWGERLHHPEYHYYMQKNQHQDDDDDATVSSSASETSGKWVESSHHCQPRRYQRLLRQVQHSDHPADLIKMVLVSAAMEKSHKVCLPFPLVSRARNKKKRDSFSELNRFMTIVFAIY